MSKHKIRLADAHTCHRQGPCMARRCENGCGQYEHTKPADLPAGCLQHDLTVSYVEGSNCGPGLIIQIRNALTAPSAARKGGSEGGTRNKPTSRPPGWNADASALLGDIKANWDRLVDDEATLGDWRRQARTILGFAVPSIGLEDVTCFVCGQASLRVAQDACSDVWCSNAEGCHDDDKYPDCGYWVDGLGYSADLGYGDAVTRQFSCRRTDRALTHAVRWPRHSWGPIWQQMQEAEALNDVRISETIGV